VIYRAHEYPPLKAEGVAALFSFGVSVVSSAGCHVEITMIMAVATIRARLLLNTTALLLP
jgi:hypothetical protein